MLAIGARLGEVPTQGYELLDSPSPPQKLLHVLGDAGELGRVYMPALGIVATPQGFAAALADVEPLDSSPWRDWLASARADYEAWQVPKPVPGRFNWARP